MIMMIIILIIIIKVVIMIIIIVITLFSLICTIFKVAFLLKCFKSVCSQQGYLCPNISIFFLKAMEIDQLSIMSKLSRSLVIDRSHDEANTISSSASKIDGLFVSLQLELNIRQPTTKWKSLFSYLMRYMSFASKMKNLFVNFCREG